VRVLRTGGAPDAGAALLLPVLEVLGALQDGHPLPRVAERHCLAALQSILVLHGDRQHDGDAQVDNAVWQERGRILMSSSLRRWSWALSKQRFSEAYVLSLERQIFQD